MPDVIPGLGLESRVPTCLTQGSFKGLGASERGRQEGNAVLAVITNKQNPRKVNVTTEAKSQSVLGFKRPATAAESSQGPLPGGVSFQPKEGRERGRGAARPGMRSPGQRDGVRPLSFGIRGRNRPGCFGSHRTWPRQNAACSEGAAPPGQRWGGPAPRGAPPPMMRRPPTGPRPVTHSSPWLQHKATSPGGRFLPEERLQRPRRRWRRKRRGRRGGRRSADAWRGCALRSRPRARRGTRVWPAAPARPPHGRRTKLPRARGPRGEQPRSGADGGGRPELRGPRGCSSSREARPTVDGGAARHRRPRPAGLVAPRPEPGSSGSAHGPPSRPAREDPGRVRASAAGAGRARAPPERLRPPSLAPP